MTHSIIELPELRDRLQVFRDRAHAGTVLAGMLQEYGDSDALILAIPAGGVPVAAPMAERLGLPLDLCVVSKILLPWTTEAGFGAVAFDGTVWINQEYVDHYRLTPEQIRRATEEARQKVARRMKRFRGDRPFPSLVDRTLILVDDGLASGATMKTAVAALRNGGAARLVVAVPTAHASSAVELAQEVDTVYCANIRTGPAFAVADAYRQWRDVGEEEVAGILARLSTGDKEE